MAHIKTLLVTLAMIAGVALFMGSTADAQSPTTPNFSSIVENVGQTVVNVQTFKKPTPSKKEGQVSDPLKKYDFIMPELGGLVPLGIGTGFVVNTKGLIITNYHVIRGADAVVVTFTDKRSFKARIIAADQTADVAVLGVNTGYDLKVINIGSSANLKVGDWVMAIGSPYGFDNTVTAGIVSAKDRNKGEYLPWIQTDVPINPGNSGGPLINSKGEVVGINTQIWTRSGSFSGISFAIPIEEAIYVIEQFAKNGHVVRAAIGIRIVDAPYSLLSENEVTRQPGAMVYAVAAGSPAEAAGLRPHDIITGVNDTVITVANELPRVMSRAGVGVPATIHVIRDGHQFDVTVTPYEMKQSTDRE